MIKFAKITIISVAFILIGCLPYTGYEIKITDFNGYVTTIRCDSYRTYTRTNTRTTNYGGQHTNIWTETHISATRKGKTEEWTIPQSSFIEYNKVFDINDIKIEKNGSSLR